MFWRKEGHTGIVLFPKIKGIRRRWLLNSVSILVMILAVVVVSFSLFVKNYYNTNVVTDMENKARTAASYFSSYFNSYSGGSDYLIAAQDYVSSFEDGTRLELQFLDPNGKVIYSSNGLTLSGTMPGTGDIQRVQSTGEISPWEGTSKQTGERITAVSAPLLYNGEMVGILRYVTSMRLVDRQVVILTLVAVILSVSILILVYISNIYFVRSIVDPVKNITGIAQRIAGGSYGIQVEKKFDDEVGDLTDAINDMSMQHQAGREHEVGVHLLGLPRAAHPPDGHHRLGRDHHERRGPGRRRTCARACASSSARPGGCRGWWRSCWSSPALRTAGLPCPWSPWTSRPSWRTRCTPTTNFWPPEGIAVYHYGLRGGVAPHPRRSRAAAAGLLQPAGQRRQARRLRQAHRHGHLPRGRGDRHHASGITAPASPRRSCPT